MASKPANAAQRKWMSDVAEWAEVNIDLIYDGANSIQLHHVLGRSAKHNKIAIGHWFIIPVPYHLHDVSSHHPESVTHCKKEFVKSFGNQRDIFRDMVNDMRMEMYALPPIEVLNSIMDTNA